MSDHFLAKLVTGETQSFSSAISYNRPGDCLQLITSDEAVIANRVDDILTIYESAIDGRPIGFKIKSVATLIKKFGLDALAVACKIEGDRVKSISLFALLLAAYEEGPQTIRRRSDYACAMAMPQNPTICADDLMLA
jgi:hypothetical protein